MMAEATTPSVGFHSALERGTEGFTTFWEDSVNESYV
jgi:hypothetical protein